MTFTIHPFFLYAGAALLILIVAVWLICAWVLSFYMRMCNDKVILKMFRRD